MRYYSADFETTNQIIAESGKLEVWLAGAVDIGTMEIANISYNIDDFMFWLRHLDHDAIVYFHNLKHDGEFLTSWMIEQGFEFVERDKEIKTSKQFTSLISDGAWYDIVFNTVKLRTGAKAYKIYCYDSLKRLPFSLDKLTKDFKVEHQKLTGTIDYNRHNEKCNILPEELEYFKHDILGLAEVIQKGILYNVKTDGNIRSRPKMTIGSECLRYYKGLVNEHYWKAYGELFPQIDDDVTAWCRKAYAGGWCYVKPDKKNIPLGKGFCLDVNSLYPSMMRESNNIYPTGQPEIITTNEDDIWALMNTKTRIYRKGMPLVWFFEFEIKFKLKPDHLPCIQIHNDPDFRAREWLESSNGKFVTMVRTEMDLALIREQYDVCIYPLKAIGFKGKTGLFDDYIDYWMDKKMNPESPSDKAISKLYLNNLYGKFSQKTHGVRYIPSGMDEHGKVILTPRVDERKSSYMPVGAFITSYARCFTIRHAQENYDIFCYADTDSLHMLGDVSDAKKCVIDDKKLSCWKVESVFTSARFIRCKTYIECGDNGNDLKCCGLMKEKQAEIAKGNNADYLVQHLDEILSNVEGGKLLRKRQAGGVALVESTFKMRGV